jgi:hypothetical protein
MKRAFDSAVEEVGACIVRLAEELDQLTWLQNSSVAVTPDHGSFARGARDDQRMPLLLEKASVPLILHATVVGARLILKWPLCVAVRHADQFCWRRPGTMAATEWASDPPWGGAATRMPWSS